MRALPSGLQNVLELIVELWVGITNQNMGPRPRANHFPV